MSKVGKLLNFILSRPTPFMFTYSCVRSTLKSLLNTPTFTYSPTQRTVRYIQTSCPLSLSKRFSFIRQHMVSTSITRLFFCSRPPAIILAITQLAIAPIQSMLASRRFTHISKKISETKPLRTDCYTFTPIHVKLSMFRVQASTLHSNPYPVNSAKRHPMLFHFDPLINESRSIVA